MDDYTPSPRSGSPLLRGVIVAAIIVIISGVVLYSKHSSNSTNTAVTVAASPTSTVTAGASAPATPSPSATATTATSIYKDGTYSATGNYVSPGGKQTIAVNITLANDVVTAATVTSGAIDPESQEYQQRFISGYKQYVIGKKIDGLSLTEVSGSSLTSQGFNKALTAIESEAKV